jgi:hypothetical protein
VFDDLRQQSRASRAAPPGRRPGLSGRETLSAAYATALRPCVVQQV